MFRMEHICKKSEPLVSVVVITYNSSNTVLETLESIKLQTYNNIELIISDDDSKDNTVSICKEWINNNIARFVKSQVISFSFNTGTAANLNRAVYAAEGEWIKPLAADDKLLPNCISDNVSFVLEHPEASVVFSKVIGFGNIVAARNWPYSNVKRYFDSFSNLQFRIILSTQNFLPAASAFFKRIVWENVDGYNEEIPLLEDWPFWVKLLNYGYSFSFLDEDTVCYRFSETSISQNEQPLSKTYLESNQKALTYARKSLNNINFYYRYLYLTLQLYRWYGIFGGILVRLLNLFNPAFYKYKNTMGAFEKM